jgi:hypothetical protein
MKAGANDAFLDLVFHLALSIRASAPGKLFGVVEFPSLPT